jgi:antitoxin ChpS
MHVATLRTVGGSTMVAIPKPILEGLRLATNAKVEMSLEQGRLVVSPRARPRYSLAELVAQCDPSAPATEEDRAWDTAGPVGREVF